MNSGKGGGRQKRQKAVGEGQRNRHKSVSMSSIKRDVKKKVLPRPEAEKILVSRSSPLTVSAPPIAFERFCSGLFALPVGFIFRW